MTVSRSLWDFLRLEVIEKARENIGTMLAVHGLRRETVQEGRAFIHEGTYPFHVHA